MNRSALTIKMLNYLKANDIVSREELAMYLETNIRNISEFKKELEVAGYHIESISGKYGGYRLAEDSLIPTIALDDEEVMALNDASKFLKNRNFHQLTSFDSALMKIKNNLRDTTISSDIHYLFYQSASSVTNDYEKLLMDAKNRRITVALSYRKLNADNWEKRLLQPYELIYSDEGNYLLAYDVTLGKKHMFKTFKISELRMKDIILSNRFFVREQDFKIEDYIGKQSILKETYEVELEIYGSHAILLYEQNIGLLANKKMKDNVLHLQFVMENKMRILEFILSLGKDCKIISPNSIKNEVISILKYSLRQYMI
ncbi:WYL domain-containing protein [Breznakia sp. OttesenSCG-928-G09]|nr:WYL domain-containing protein [Breznakia sp. OttesenSCG-928-G09]